MSTVLGDLTLTFRDQTIVEPFSAPIAPEIAADPVLLADELLLLGIDAALSVNLPSLVDLYGPLQGLAWEATLVPLPASLWLLAGACVWLVSHAKR